MVLEGEYDINANNSIGSESHGSFAQNQSENHSACTYSGCKVIKLKKYLTTIIFGYLSTQSGINIE